MWSKPVAEAFAKAWRAWRTVRQHPAARAWVVTAPRNRFTQVREPLDDEHMTVPASEIFARNRRRSVRRRLMAAAVGCAAIATPRSVPAADLQAVWEFAPTSAPLTCAKLVQP